jgi:hypothetical protein
VIYLGDFPADTVQVDFSFNTRKADGTPVALEGGRLAVYKDDATTELVLVAVCDLAAVATGQYNVTVYVTQSGSRPFVAGSDYKVVLSAGTVDGTSVAGTVLAQFSIENRYTGASVAGNGAVEWQYSLTEEGSSDPIPDCRVWVTSDEEGRVVIGGPLYTNAAGSCTFHLDEGTVYVWCMKAGYLFANPDEETVAAE